MKVKTNTNQALLALFNSIPPDSTCGQNLKRAIANKSFNPKQIKTISKQDKEFANSQAIYNLETNEILISENILASSALQKHQEIFFTNTLCHELTHWHDFNQVMKTGKVNRLANLAVSFQNFTNCLNIHGAKGINIKKINELSREDIFYPKWSSLQSAIPTVGYLAASSTKMPGVTVLNKHSGLHYYAYPIGDNIWTISYGPSSVKSYMDFYQGTLTNAELKRMKNYLKINSTTAEVFSQLTSMAQYLFAVLLHSNYLANEQTKTLNMSHKDKIAQFNKCYENSKGVCSQTFLRLIMESSAYPSGYLFNPEKIFSQLGQLCQAPNTTNIATINKRAINNSTSLVAKNNTISVDNNFNPTTTDKFLSTQSLMIEPYSCSYAALTSSLQTACHQFGERNNIPLSMQLLLAEVIDCSLMLCFGFSGGEIVMAKLFQQLLILSGLLLVTKIPQSQLNKAVVIGATASFSLFWNSGLSVKNVTNFVATSASALLGSTFANNLFRMS